MSLLFAFPKYVSDTPTSFISISLFVRSRATQYKTAHFFYRVQRFLYGRSIRPVHEINVMMHLDTYENKGNPINQSIICHEYHVDATVIVRNNICNK